MASVTRCLRLIVAFLALACAVLFAGCASGTATPAAGGTARGAETLATASSSAVASNAPLHTCAAPYPSGVPTAATVFCADPSRMQTARVLRIVDGDTIHVEIDGKEEIIRFYGDNTTEHGQRCFDEATARTRELVGDEVRLLPDARNRDKYGRLLRYVYSPSGLNVEAEMVAEGLAHAWRPDGALRFAIIAVEDQAQQGHVGCLWQ
jgi:micrococcal nuclease